jgi:class 3 adenylate cyclase
VRVCPSCAAENPERARFCLDCGARLEPAEPAAEERKVVSVLFADLVGFTSRSERMDVEDVRGTLVPYHALLRRQLERFGGTVEKFIGDAVMALFGAPVAHEDDADRAVRAGLAIQEALAQLRDADPRLDLQVRIGVTTGEALIALGASTAQGEGMASGDVVNTAARLQTAAPAGGVLVDEATFRATGRAIEYEPVEPVLAKGKREPVTAWLARAARARVGSDVVQDAAAPLVGRESELGALGAALERAVRDIEPQLVTLVGVPGIGKSRLLWELYRQVDDGPRLVIWRQGRCLPYGDGVTFWAFAEMVKAQAGVLESDGGEERAAKLAAMVGDLLADGEERAWVERHLRPLLGIEAHGEDQGEPAARYAAWRRLVEALAAVHPVVLAFEDLHWADEALLDFVDHLVDWAGDVPLLVVATARPELLERRPGWGGGRPGSATLALRPLSGEATARLVAALLDQRLLPSDLQQELLARSDGNPLYAHEYVRMLIERRLVARGGGGWTLRAGADLRPPETLQAVIAARLDALPKSEKEVLRDAAVMGKVFWLGAVSELGGWKRSQLTEALHRLDRKEFVRRQRQSSVAGDVEYAFRHVLVRDVAYGQLTRSQRARKHLAAARYIESLSSECFDRTEVLAHHHLTALELTRLGGGDVSQISTAASRALRDAADRAEELNMDRAVRRFAAAALALERPVLDRRERLRVELQLLLAQLRLDDVLPDRLQAVAEELAALGLRRPAVRALGELGPWLSNHGQSEREEAVLRRALEVHGDAPRDDAWGMAAGALAISLVLTRRDVPRGVELASEIVGIAHELGLEEQAGVHGMTVALGHLMLDDERAGAEADASVEIALRHPSYVSAIAVVNGGEVAMALADLDLAERREAAGRSMAERLGIAFVVDWALWTQAQLAFLRGRWEDALKRVRRQPEAGAGALLGTLLRAQLELTAEQPAAAARTAAAAARLFHEAPDVGIVVEQRALRARALAASGDAAPARDALDAAIRGLDGGLVQWGRSLPMAAHAAALLGEPRRLEGVLRRARVRSAWIDAAAAVGSGNLDAAAAIYERIGSVPDLALALVERANELARGGRHAEARERRTRAEALLAGLPRDTEARADGVQS